MADEQFFENRQYDLNGDGFIDEIDINMMYSDSSIHKNVERTMNEQVDTWNLREINKKRKEKKMENENEKEKSPEEKLRDKYIAHDINEKEAMEFNNLVKEGKIEPLTAEEEELKRANRERKQNEEEYSFYDEVQKESEIDEELDKKPKTKSIEEEEEDLGKKTKTKGVEEEEEDLGKKPKTKGVEEEEEDLGKKTKTKDMDAEIDDKAPKQNTTDLDNVKDTNVTQPQQQYQPQQYNMGQAPSSQKGKEAVNEVLTGLAEFSEHAGGIGKSIGTITGGLGKGLAAIFLKLKENYNGEEYRPPEGVREAFNGVANFASDMLKDMPEEFNNPITQAMINSFKITPTRDANVNKDDKGNFQGDVVDKPKDMQTEMTETMIKDRLVNENTMGLLASIHLAGGTEKDKDGHIVLKDDVYNSLEGKLDKKEVAALGASLYAVNNFDKLDTNDKHINSVVEMAKGFNNPEMLEKSLSVLYEAGGKEAAANPERNTESILVSPANIVNVAEALKDTPSINAKSFDKQLDAVHKGVKEVTQVNHTTVSRDASKATAKMLDYLQNREKAQSQDKSKDIGKDR